MTTMAATRQVAIYARVSSDDQAERGTIATQLAEIDHWVARNPDVVIGERYLDDGVSGMIPLDQRPAGSKLLRDAAAARFTEVLVYKHDRLGRDLVGLAIARRRFDELKIVLTSVVEGQTDLLVYDIQAAVAAHVRRELLHNMAVGMHRAAEEGRYTGGICGYGFRVEGKKETARLVPDDRIAWADRTAADIVRQIYDWLAVDHWSCRRIATTLNSWGVPTHYARDGRPVAPHKGERRERTQAVWRSGRIRNLVTNAVYRGELQYGRRSNRPDREIIAASVQGLVSRETWQAAIETLARNQIIPKNTERVYLLRGVMTCGECGLRYGGTQGRTGSWWYRCGGKQAERGSLAGRCASRHVPGAQTDEIVWTDIERFLRNPGDILAELDGQGEREEGRAIAEANAVAFSRRLDQLQDERIGLQRLAARGSLTDAELDGHLARIAGDRREIDRQLAELAPRDDLEPVPTGVDDLLTELRATIDAGLSDNQRHEIVAHLVRIRVLREADSDLPTTRLRIEYRFPGGVSTRTDIREDINYTIRQRVIELPAGRRPVKAFA